MFKKVKWFLKSSKKPFGILYLEVIKIYSSNVGLMLKKLWLDFSNRFMSFTPHNVLKIALIKTGTHYYANPKQNLGASGLTCLQLRKFCKLYGNT